MSPGDPQRFGRVVLLVAAVVLASCGGEGSSASRAEAPPQSMAPLPSGSVESNCDTLGAPGRYSRTVLGQHRGCFSDADCVTVPIQCGNVACTAVHRDFGERYRDEIDCAGYPGTVADYDCRPQYLSEAPRCRSGCCVSERLRETAETEPDP